MSEKEKITSKKCTKCYWCEYADLGVEEPRVKPHKCLNPKTEFTYLSCVIARGEDLDKCEHFLYWKEDKEALKKSAPHDPRITKEGEH